jgi:decaprenyl-phosphate phosphoribosyltransferase
MKLAGYIEIARLDHWVKNILVLPGYVVALSVDPGRFHSANPLHLVAGLTAICLITSSNYVLNEILDAPSDRLHPYKSARPIAAHRVRTRDAYVEWILLMAIGLGLGSIVSFPYMLTLAGLWIAGCAYNVPPLRTKDVPYLDVLSEAINNPLRMLAGWFLTTTQAVPITSLLISYWMVGCYLMAIKRYAEYRELTPEVLSRYRKVFRSYSERSLLASILFYGSQAMLFLGTFIARYRLELIVSFPLIALVMAVYFWLAFRPNSPVQHPEALYREPLVVVPVVLCAAIMTLLLFVDIPLLHEMFPPTRVGF